MMLDIGVGILLAIFTSRLFEMPLTVVFVIGGAIFALLMDLDYLFHLYKEGSSKKAHKHRNSLHFPLLYIPLGTLIISFFSASWAVLFGFCSFAHFFHDSIGIGWGIQWLYPFRKEHYSFFYIYKPDRPEKLPNKFIYTWKHEDIDLLAKKYGDENWLENIYWRWHPYAIVEFLTFILALIALFFYVR